MPLAVEIARRGPGSRNVRLVGALDAASSATLDADAASICSGVTLVVLDLAGLEYVSSAGIRSLFKLRKRMEGASGSVVLVNVRPSVRKVLDIVKALPGQPIFQSERELDDYLAAMQRRVRGGSAES